jgi:two-component system, OmpR family, sensor kinase
LIDHAGADTGRQPAAAFRRWAGRRTLRGQLIAGLLALLAVACASVGLVTYAVLHQTLLTQLDYQLQGAGGRYASCMEQNAHESPPPPPGPPPQKPQASAPRKLLIWASRNPQGVAPQKPQTAAFREPRKPAPQNCNKTPGLGAGTFGARLKNGIVTNQGVINGRSHLTAADKAALVRLPADGRTHTERLGSLNGDYRLVATHGADG